MHRIGSLVLVFVIALISSSGCKAREETMTLAEASDALQEASISSQATTLVSGSIEIATNFTIGDAVEAAAAELGSFIESQLPCAEVTLAGNSLTVTYGANAGDCTYKGLTYEGTHTITVSSNDMSQVIVEHSWAQLTNGIVSVTGSATVTWDFEAKSRHIVHELDWTRVSDGRSATGSGDRTQTVLAGGLVEGIRIDGSRRWEGKGGTWDLQIVGVEVRWIDAVPQSGSYLLDAPNGKSAELSFVRLDDNTIEVTFATGTRDFSFHVTTLGEISDN